MAEHGRLFEASWEVCNKVGGIYTVVTSKVPHAVSEYGSGYLAIGPYLGQTARDGFDERPLPSDWERIAAAVGKHGIVLRYGVWQIEGSPAVLLIDWMGMVPRLNEHKARLWEQFQLDTLGSDFYDIDTPLLWSLAIGMVAEAAAQQREDKITLQLHEWMTGGAVLHLSQAGQQNVRTVFTTHATVLGRSLCSRDVFIYDKLDSLDAAEEARRGGVFTKHQLERLAATQSTVFTTVSKVTAEEAAAFLGRTPDVIVENALDTGAFPPFDEVCWSAHHIREKVQMFIEDYFAPSYPLDSSRYSLQFTMGRYEVRNKGYDLYLKTLGTLNEQLKASEAERGVIALLMVPGDALAPRPDVSLMVSLGGLTEEQAEKLPSYQEVPVSPYVLRQGQNDQIVRLCAQYGLRNRQEDRVKVLFFPAYFNGLDGIFNEHIYDLASACDLGVFPSLYEPWGYTPMEALAMGVPSVTSNLSGFGRAVAHPTPGCFIVNRQAGEEPAAKELLEVMRLSLQESSRQWVERRMSAYHTVQSFGWERLYGNYQRAYAQAWQ